MIVQIVSGKLVIQSVNCLLKWPQSAVFGVELRLSCILIRIILSRQLTSTLGLWQS